MTRLLLLKSQHLLLKKPQLKQLRILRMQLSTATPNGEGDTLKAASGGNYPGLIHLKKDGDEYEVVKMDTVADGGNFESSAKEIFGDKYDAFMKVNGDSEAREKLRAEIIANFVKANGLNFTKYQDEGWDPVDIPL